MENRQRYPPNIDGIYRSRPQRPVPHVPAAYDPGIYKQSGNESKIPKGRVANEHLNTTAASPSRRGLALPRSGAYVQPKRTVRWSAKRKVGTVALLILLIGLGFGGFYGARLLSSVNKVFHGNVFTDAAALWSNTPLKGEGQGRVNILLAGDSADDPNHGGAQLTDSIMIVSINTQNHTGFMLSIPRDLWVHIPGWSHQKINAANDVVDFNQAGYPKGGMGQLQQIVQTDLGIPIDYYALINYAAFKDAVTAVGGITITIQSTDPRGLFDPNIAKVDGGPLKIPNGAVVLDGQTALNVARARGDPCGCGQYEYGFPHSDYDRTQHQREMLTALAQKAQTAGVIANPFKVTQLFDAFGNNVATDLNLQNVLRFVKLTKGINISNIQSITYPDSGPTTLLMNYIDPGSGQEALIPKAGLDSFGQLQQYYQRLTSDSPIVKESPTVVILNASNVTGLAHKEQIALQRKNIDVVGIADANGQYPTTMIVDNSNGQKPASKQLLQQLFTGTITTNTTSSTEAAEAKGYTADYVVILGQNWSPAK